MAIHIERKLVETLVGLRMWTTIKSSSPRGVPCRWEHAEPLGWMDLPSHFMRRGYYDLSTELHVLQETGVQVSYGVYYYLF